MPHPFVVELHVPDFESAIVFYGMLGFTVARRDDRYLVLERQGYILCFNEGSDAVYNQSYFRKFDRQTKRGYAVEIVIPVDDVRALYDAVKDKMNIITPLEKKHWGLWDFRVEDPFGFYLRITEPPDWRTSQPTE
ncbi:hypothetical protein HZA86_04605 [Candidatus Uhrbacteria bacterium]|nr:hypothetical protein [Candidatus Uhrbacteria bacterium]